MQDKLAIREAHRLFRWSVAIRLVVTALFLLMLALRSPAGINWTPEGRPVPPVRIAPMLLVTVLAFTPWLERILGRYALAVLLVLDVFGVSAQAVPLFFYHQELGGELHILEGTFSPQWTEALLAEPLSWLLIPLVLSAWAYGRRGALLASTWAVLLHLGSGLLVLRGGLLSRGFWIEELVRISIIYAVPLVVSTLAQREHRQVRELEASHARLRRYAATIEQLAVSRERNRLARDLHDTLAHSLAALTVHLEALRTLQTHDPAEAHEAADKALDLARQGLAESRQAIQALRADPLATLGLTGAVRSLLQDFQSRTGVSAEFRVAGREPDLTNEEVQALFRIAEEALTNVERHASARYVNVRLSFGTQRIDLMIRDDGTGFDPKAVDADRYGLLGMQERAAMIEATLEVNSTAGGGTEVWCSLER